MAAIQLAVQQQCLVASTASSDGKLAVCSKYGADVCINYHSKGFVREVSNQLGGVDLIVDVVGGEYLNDNIRVLNLDGTIVQLAILGGRYTKQFDMALMLSRRATIKASTLRNRSHEYKTQLIEAFSHQFLSHFNDKKLTPVIDTVFPIEQVALAHERLEKNDSIGKFVINW